jgi:signal transduction histidine kinase
VGNALQELTQFDINPVIDTDFILLHHDVSLGDAMPAVLRRPGRLGVVQDTQQKILGCIDAYVIARALQRGQGAATPLTTITLANPALIGVTETLSGLLDLFLKDLYRPVLVKSGDGALLGHVPPARLLQWISPRQLEVLQNVSDLKSDLERRDEYLEIVSHDLRAPLSVIQLATDYLQLPEQEQGMTEQVRSFIERIRRNCTNAQSLVTGLLDTVRASGGLQLNYDQVVLSGVINDLVKSLSIVAEKRGLKIVARHVDEIKIYLDVERIRQVFENVIMNAIKYAPQGASIGVRTQLQEHEGQTYALFQVTNPGNRITLEEGRRLLDPFVQGANQGATKDGVGLGLSIVKKIVELHEGIIEFGGDKEHEVSFKVLLPNATSVLSLHKGQGRRTQRSVLVVDDDPEIRDFTEAVLAAAGFEVLTAEDGARAFSLFQRHKPDLVMSDIRMNKVDGFELLAKVREVNSNVPFILCSGYYLGLEKDLQHSNLKPDLFIDKPFKITELVRDIEAVLKASRDKAS